MLTPTRLFDRPSGAIVTEQVFGGTMLSLAYESRIGRAVGRWPTLQRAVSRIVGWYQSTRHSARGIAPFVAQYGIQSADFELPAGGYRTFNEFFFRRLAPGARPFPADTSVLGAAAEGRLSVFPIASPATPLTIKGVPLSIATLVGSEVTANACVGGHAFVFRLCPVDYHRFHFPDAGLPEPARTLDGQLHSVHPVAQRVVPDLFLRNERQVAGFLSERFGRLVLVDVGAMCVGTIVQTYRPGVPVARGDEKGYFAFGGSTTIVLTERGRVAPDGDLLEHTAAGLETLVRVGEPVGRAIPAEPRVTNPQANPGSS
ncbi:MAG: phosphatidylserine decarboxylase [bacterium]